MSECNDLLRSAALCTSVSDYLVLRQKPATRSSSPHNTHLPATLCSTALCTSASRRLVMRQRPAALSRQQEGTGVVGASSSCSVRTSTTAAISLGRGMSLWACQLLRTACGQPAPSVMWTTTTCLQGMSLLYSAH